MGNVSSRYNAIEVNADSVDREKIDCYWRKDRFSISFNQIYWADEYIDSETLDRWLEIYAVARVRGKNRHMHFSIDLPFLHENYENFSGLRQAQPDRDDNSQQSKSSSQMFNGTSTSSTQPMPSQGIDAQPNHGRTITAEQNFEFTVAKSALSSAQMQPMIKVSRSTSEDFGKSKKISSPANTSTQTSPRRSPHDLDSSVAKTASMRSDLVSPITRRTSPSTSQPVIHQQTDDCYNSNPSLEKNMLRRNVFERGPSQNNWPPINQTTRQKPRKDSTRVQLSQKNSPLHLADRIKRDPAEKMKDILMERFAGMQDILVYMNPISGKRQGPVILEHLLQPMLDRPKHFCTSVVRTERGGHIYDHIKHADLSNVGTIAVLGGDGTFVEMLNGIAARADAREVFLRVRVAIVPMGTANALANSAWLSDPLLACAAIFHKHYVHLDCMKITSPEMEVPEYAVCAVYYGFLAELLEKAEARRGKNARFVRAFMKTIFKKMYQVRIREQQSLYPSGERVSLSHLETCGTDCALCKRRAERFLTESRFGGNADPLPFWEESVDVEIQDTRFLLVANSSCRDNGGICAIPKAHLASGTLSIMFIPARTNIVKFFAKFGLQKHIDKKMTLSEAQSIEIEFITNIPIAIDGELKHDVTYMRIESVPAMLRLANNPAFLPERE